MRYFRDSSDSEFLPYVILLNQQITRHIGFTQCKEYCITPKRLLSLFEESSSSNISITLCCLSQFSLLIHQSEDLFHFFRPHISTKSHFAKLLLILSYKEANVRSILRKMDGTNFGFPHQGMYDSVVYFLASYLERIGPAKEETSLFFLLMKETGLDVELQQLAGNIEKDLFLSPKGMHSYLLFLSDCANMKKLGGSHFAEDLLSVDECEDRLPR